MLRLVDRYLIREIVPYFLLALLLLTAIVFAHEASRFSELLVVSSRNGLPMDALWKVLAALIPGILVFTLPISLLIGTLVGLGRLSGDSEIIALRASGVSRARILAPVVAIAVVSAGVMVFVTLNALPRSIRNLNDLKSNQSLIFQGLNTQIKPRVFEESIPKKVIYIEEIDRARNLWHNIFLVDLGDDQGEMKVFTATSGWLRQGSRSDMPELHLEHVSAHQITETRNPPHPDQEQSAPSEPDPQPAAADPQPPQEKEKKRRLRQSYNAAHYDQMTLGIEVSDEKRPESEAPIEERNDVQEMQWGELIQFTPPDKEYRRWRVELHKRLAFPAACLVFALLGVGFGISNVRTGRSFGLLLGLAITVAYYLIALSGEKSAVSGKLPVWLGIWLANMSLTALGVLVILAFRHPGADPLSLLRNLRHAWRPGSSDAETRGRDTAARNGSPPASGRRPVGASIFGFRVPQLIDRLVLSDLVRFFFFILSGLTILFLIITLFQLLDAITRNNTEWGVVANYLLFLTPWFVNYIAPLAALVAVMITFGILQKTSQVIALKASGQSIYRLAAPALLGAVLLSAFVFLNQDYVLPFTNRRQNNLRHLIRSGQEPPQTFYQTTNQWIFGYDSRIFNYAHFDVTNNSFYRLNVLDLSREPFGIKGRVYARSASWDAAAGEWVLENGWERRFEGERLSYYEPFRNRRVKLSERPEYFKKDPRGSTSMTLAELRRKIADLSRSGFDVLELRIALQGKIAFPLTCLVMVIVGLPFSFSVGKRGALFGVTIGIVIALVYWGLLGLFEQMGRYEILPPMLAAWGPNLLFGAGGVYLFLTSRT
ncbi:MAG TPA: LptF/LptG family permease [Blastocatellia bacterium]|nr:LptF/LptG family permease [Blastocatellia bacterium]